MSFTFINSERNMNEGPSALPSTCATSSVNDLPERDDYVYSSEEMTVRSCEIWNELPEEIKHDPILASFREGYQQHHQISDFDDDDDDPILRKPSTVKDNASGQVMYEEQDAKISPRMRYSKLSIVFITWIFFTAILMYKHEHSINSMHQISVPENKIRSYWILQRPSTHQIRVELEGALLPNYYGNISQKWLTVWIELIQTRKTNSSKIDESDVFYAQKITSEWIVPLVPEELLEYDVPEVRSRHLFDVIGVDQSLLSQSYLRIRFKTNLAASFPLAISYDLWPIDASIGIIYASLVLFGLYVVIIFEIIHRTIAAMSAAVTSIAILAVLNERPTKMELASWVDIESLLLLASMMVIVAIISKSGVFDYLAVLTYKFTRGNIWPLVNTLCFFTAIISSVLDSVTTALLMTPVTIRLSEVLNVNPVPILMAMIMYSNIGGAITPVGDPPNVILAMNDDVINAGVNFLTFVKNMSFPLIIIMICTHLLLRFMLKKELEEETGKDSREVRELRHEINIWKRAAASLSSYSKDEDAVRVSLLEKVQILLFQLKKTKTNNTSISQSGKDHHFSTTLKELQEKYPIRDKGLLLKSGVCLLFVIVMFFLHSIPEPNLSMGWAAFLGALLLLLSADEESVEGVLASIEWSTLIFFGALFIMMEALSRLGLIEWIGSQTEEIIMSIEEKNRLGAALVLILWVSGLASSFVDNIPLTTMMVKIITRLSQKEGLELPLPPLVWALALGACLGGNGTLIGASSNVVCAGVAEQHGYRFTFMEFLRMGLPVTLLSMTVATLYLLIMHAWLQVSP